MGEETLEKLLSDLDAWLQDPPTPMSNGYLEYVEALRYFAVEMRSRISMAPKVEVFEVGGDLDDEQVGNVVCTGTVEELRKSGKILYKKVALIQVD